MLQERYELVDVIGSGGMATVWRARDTLLGRVVALKRPHPAPVDSTVVRRFAREARAAATVNHPNLVSVYDVGEDDAGPYLVMEFVDGPSLATASVPSQDAARIGAQVAAALAALHAAGVVHGDVKPGNILIAGDGVKLTDFGIARTGDDTSALTREGTIFATPEYAAPETLAGEARTPAADVYALGSVLHELVTGSRWNPSVATTQAMPAPAWLAVLGAALDHDPAQRPTAAALGLQLAQLDDAAALPAATVPSARGATSPGSYAASAPPRAAAPLPPSRPAARDRRSATTATAIFAGSILAIAAVAGLAMAMTGDGDGLDGLAATSAPFTQSTTPAPSASPTATVAPSAAPTTAAPTTVAATSPPPTEAPTTTITPAVAIANELVALLADEVDQGMNRDEAVAIVERIDQAIRAAANGEDEQVEKSLREALERIERHVSDDARDEAVDRLYALAVELGVDPERIEGPPGPPGRGDERGRGEGDEDD